MAHPRDHILPLSYLGSAAQTDVTLVTVKVRVNGGSPTTYTNVSTPAITQNADNTSLYELDIPANTYADGDRVARTWYYNSVVQTSGVDMIGPAAVDGAYYTTSRGSKLDYLDTAVSGVATAVWAVGTRTLTSFGTLAADTAAAVWNSLTSGLTTVGSIGKLIVTNLDAAISSIPGLFTSGTVTVVSPVLSASRLSLVQGDDYKAADSRALIFTSSDWPSLTGAAISLELRNSPTASPTSYAGTATSATTAQIELAGTQTAALDGAYRFDVVATLSGGNVVTLTNGICDVAALP